MKTIITLSLISIVQLSVFAQANITREISKLWDEDKQDWKNISEIIYEYNSNKEITLHLESFWFADENKFLGDKQITFEYSDKRTFISEFRAIHDNGNLYWVLSDTSEYIFNKEDCRIQFNENSEFTDWRLEYEYFEDCLIKSATRSAKERSSTDDWQPFERTIYTYSNNNLNKNFVVDQYLGDEVWFPLSNGYEYQDERGNIVEKFSSDPTELFENTYDEKDRLIHQFLYKPAGSENILTLRRETKYEHFEDKNGFLVKMLVHRRYDSEVEFFTYTFLYENYCDGLVRTEEYTRHDGTRKQWVYEYDEPTNCLENEEIKLQISPNPTSGLLIIASDLLFQNTNISIYSSNGQLIQNIPVTQRTNLQEINLKDLPNGAYFVRLKSDAHSITAPFVIVK